MKYGLSARGKKKGGKKKKDKTLQIEASFAS